MKTQKRSKLNVGIKKLKKMKRSYKENLMSNTRKIIEAKNVSAELHKFLIDMKVNTVSFSGLDLNDINFRNDCGDSLLHIAVRFYDDPNIIKDLIELGLDVDTLGDMKETPLHVACGCNNFEAVKVLLRYDAKLDSVSEFNRSPIDKLKSLGYSTIEEYLNNRKSIK